MTRGMLIGGSSSEGSINSASATVAEFAATTFQWRSMTSAGYGSWRVSTRSSASRTGASSGSSSERSGKAGAWPAASSSWFRSRNGTSSCSASSSTISALGVERPVSTKLRCRAEMPASSARSSCVRRRRVRHSRSSGPTRGWELTVAISWWATLAASVPRLDYLRGNRQDDPPMRSSAHDDIEPISRAFERTSPCVSRPGHCRPARSARSVRCFPRRTRSRCRRIRRSNVLLDDRGVGTRRSHGVCGRLSRLASQGGGEGGNPPLVAVRPCDLRRPLLRISPLPLLPRTEMDRGRRSSATAGAC